MNTKTAEEYFEANKISFNGVNAGDYIEKEDFINYAAPLKKRIEELEAERDHFETLYKQGLVIIDTINISNHGK